MGKNTLGFAERTRVYEKLKSVIERGDLITFDDDPKTCCYANGMTEQGVADEMNADPNVNFYVTRSHVGSIRTEMFGHIAVRSVASNNGAMEQLQVKVNKMHLQMESHFAAIEREMRDRTDALYRRVATLEGNSRLALDETQR